MDPVTTQNTPTEDATPRTPTPPTPENTNGIGPLIGTGIVVVLLIFGGLYVWGTTMHSESAESADAVYDEVDITTQQDEPDAIESSLDAFDTASFEAELEAQLQAIEAEL